MNSLRIEAATIENAKKLMPNIRANDVKELQDAYDVPLEIGLLMPIYRKETVDILMCGSEPLAIGGVSNNNKAGIEKIGTIWFVGTQCLFDLYPRSLMALSKPWIADNMANYTLLRNYVSEENKIHLRWATYLGFKLVERIDSFGVSGKPFWRIEKRIRYPMLNQGTP